MSAINDGYNKESASSPTSPQSALTPPPAHDNAKASTLSTRVMQTRQNTFSASTSPLSPNSLSDIDDFINLPLLPPSTASIETAAASIATAAAAPEPWRDQKERASKAQTNSNPSSPLQTSLTYKSSSKSFAKYKAWLRQRNQNPSSETSSPATAAGSYSSATNSPLIPNGASNTPETQTMNPNIVATHTATRAAEKLNKAINKCAEGCRLIPIQRQPIAGTASVLRDHNGDFYQLDLESSGDLKVETAGRPDVLQRKHMHNCWLVNQRKNKINADTYALQPELHRLKTQVETLLSSKLKEQIKTRLGTLEGFWGWIAVRGKEKEKAAANEFMGLHAAELAKYNQAVRSLRESLGIAVEEDEFYESKLFKEHFRKELAILESEKKNQTNKKQESSFEKFLNKLKQIKNKKNKIVKGEFSVQQAIETAHPEQWDKFKAFINIYTKQNKLFQTNTLVVNKKQILKNIENQLWNNPKFARYQKEFENPKFLEECVKYANHQILNLIQEDERHSFARFPRFFKIHMAFQRAILKLSSAAKRPHALFSPRTSLAEAVSKKFTALDKKHAEVNSKHSKSAASTAAKPSATSAVAAAPAIEKAKKGPKGLYRFTQGKHSPQSKSKCDFEMEKLVLLFSSIFSDEWVEKNFKFQDAHLMVYPAIFGNKYIQSSNVFTSPKMSSFSADGYQHLDGGDDLETMSKAYNELIDTLLKKHPHDQQAFVNEAAKTVLLHCLMFSSNVDHLPSICNEFDHITEVDIETRTAAKTQKDSKAAKASDYKTMIREGFLKLIKANKALNLKEAMEVFQDYMKGCEISLKAKLGNRAKKIKDSSLNKLLELSLIINRCFAFVDIVREGDPQAAKKLDFDTQVK
jgi:hypothetical protein